MLIRILSARDVYDLLPMTEWMDVLEETLKTLGRGDGVNQLRSMLRFPDGNGLLGLKQGNLK